MNNTLTRWAIAAIALNVVVLLGLSILLNSGSGLLVGSTAGSSTTEPAAGGSVDGAVPSEGQPGVASNSPQVAVTLDIALSSDSVDEFLDALEDEDVTATFFVTGTDIAGNEAVLRQIFDAEHEIGLGSYNRSSIGELSVEDQVQQYDLTQRLVEAVTGTSPRLVRLTHSSDAASLPSAELAAARNLQDAGYVAVLSNAVLTDEAMSVDFDGSNGVVLVGDSSTPEALEDLLGELTREQYELTTVSEFGGLEPAARTGFFRSVQNKALLNTIAFQSHVWTVLVVAAVVLGTIVIARYALGLLVLLVRRRSDRSDNRSGASYAPAVSVLIPAHNAEYELKRTISSLKESDYSGALEIVVIDDGSTDNTAAVARQLDGVRVLSQSHMGSAAAANEGVRVARHDICVLTRPGVDFGRDTITRLVAPLSDPTVAVVSGSSMNRRKTWFQKIDAVEQILRFRLHQQTEVAFGLGTETSRIASALRRSAVVDVGGVAPVTTAEIMDLTVSLGTRGWNLAVSTDSPVMVTGNSSLRSLWDEMLVQRYGALQVMWKHRKSYPGRNNSRYRIPALVRHLVSEFIIPLLSPLIDIVFLVSLLSGRTGVFTAIWYVSVAIQLFAVWVAIFVSSAKDSLMIYSIPQLFFFRYLNAIVAARALLLVVDGRRKNNKIPKSLRPRVSSDVNDVDLSQSKNPMAVRR